MNFKGHNIVGLTDSALTAIRWKDLSVVMQSAMNALNPVKSIGAQFKDAMRAHGVHSEDEIAARSAEVLQMVGIDPIHLKSYPHQLSGGMRQRSMIAMALLFTPDLVIMDEPTSALDVVAQRSLMVQIKELQREFGFAVIFVTHDMSLVSHFSDQLMVMYAGQVAEVGVDPAAVRPPLHPYTAGLMEAFPSIRGPKVALSGIPGNPPDLANPPPGCRFAPRCPKVFDRCRTERPGLYQVDGTLVRCLLFEGASRVGAAGPGCHGERGMAEPWARQAQVLADGTEPLLRTEKPDQALQDRQRDLAEDLHAVDDVNLSVGEREIVALAGESGSGKSTIARLLAKIYKPTSGEVYFEGRPISSLRSRKDRLWYSGLAPWCSRTRSLHQPGVPGRPTACCAA